MSANYHYLCMHSHYSKYIFFKHLPTNLPVNFKSYWKYYKDKNSNGNMWLQRWDVECNKYEHQIGKYLLKSGKKKPSNQHKHSYLV